MRQHEGYVDPIALDYLKAPLGDANDIGIFTLFNSRLERSDDAEAKIALRHSPPKYPLDIPLQKPLRCGLYFCLEIVEPLMNKFLSSGHFFWSKGMVFILNWSVT